MYQRILVPFDGSSHAENALKSAISLVNGRESQSHLTVLHVQTELKYVMYDTTGIVINYDDLRRASEEEGKQVLHKATDILRQTTVPFETKMVFGDPAQEIFKAAQGENYDLIVMGSRGLGMMTELAIGSVSHKVIHQTKLPVLIVK